MTRACVRHPLLPGQARSRRQEISDEDFGQALAGDALGAATDALLPEIADFFPKGRREVMQRMLAKLTALQDKATSLALLKLDDPELDRQMEAELQSAMEGAGASLGRRPVPAMLGARRNRRRRARRIYPPRADLDGGRRLVGEWRCWPPRLPTPIPSAGEGAKWPSRGTSTPSSSLAQRPSRPNGRAAVAGAGGAN